MVDQITLDFLLKSSVDTWNQWRQENTHAPLDFRNAFLMGRFFNGFDFSYCNFRDANLMNCELKKVNFSNSDVSFTDFSGAKLSNAIFSETQLVRSQFNHSNLRNVKFSNVVISHTDFTGSLLSEVSIDSSEVDFCVFDVATFSNSIISKASSIASSFFKTDLSQSAFINCNLKGAIFIETNIEQSIFENCNIFGISCWKMIGTPKTMRNLNISDFNENKITLDNLEIAQFLYLLLNNTQIHSVIDNISTKIVLILGRFSEEQKPILDFIRAKLPDYDLIPVIFDFECPKTRDLDETISILASLSKFVIIDITDPRSTPQEMKGFIESHPSIPVQPIIRQGGKVYGMFEHFERYSWVLKIQTYNNLSDLQQNFNEKIISPVTAWFKEIKQNEN